MRTVIVIIVVLVLAALAAAAFVLMQNRRRAELQNRFGPEYDRAVEGAPNRREAEHHLADVAQRRDELTIRELNAAERAGFRAEWDVVQARFVDQPGPAVDAAEQLVTRVMRERGYPVEAFDERADLIAADHPDVVQHYRDAHSAHERHRTTGGIDTEDLRKSFVHYRALFGALVDDEPHRSPTTTSDSASDATRPVGADSEKRDIPSSHPQETR